MNAPPGARIRLGEILIMQGAITELDISAVLDKQAERGGRFGEIVVETGAATPDQVDNALREQAGLLAGPG